MVGGNSNLYRIRKKERKKHMQIMFSLKHGM